jgi:hypothetical protein
VCYTEAARASQFNFAMTFSLPSRPSSETFSPFINKTK